MSTVLQEYFFKELSNILELVSTKKNQMDFILTFFENALKKANCNLVFLNKEKKISYKKDNPAPVIESELLLKQINAKNKEVFSYDDKKSNHFVLYMFDDDEYGKVFLLLTVDEEFSHEKIFFIKSILETIIKIFEKYKSPEYSAEELRKLLSNEEMYRSVFENTGTGTIIIDSEMLILYANQKFCQLTGYKKEELENKTKWSIFVAPEDVDKMQRYHYGRRKSEKNVPEEYECRVIDKFDNLKYIYMKVGMIPATDRSIASFMDITNRKEAELKLRERESQLSVMVENFEGLIYIVNENYEIEFMNKTLEKRGIKETAGKCFNFLHGFESPCPWCAVDKALKGRIVKEEIFSPYDNRWYSSVTSPLHTSPENISKIQAILIDITERKLNETRLMESAENLKNENIKLKSSIKERYRLGNIIGKSRKMQEVYELILKAAESNAHVIVYGESGTGKELVAGEIHRISSRSRENFVPVNCGAISEKLIESEFFGYKKGAFTGADSDKKGFLDMADKGTLFLDEIGEIGLNMQVKLLRAIDDAGYTPVGAAQVKNSDLRIIAATNRNLKELVKERHMREDFFYRIHVIPIKLPPLRERKDDIPLLAEHFISSMNLGSASVLSGRVMDAFQKYNWPGNIRELQNVLNRYIAIGDISPLNSYEDSCEGGGFEEDFLRPLADIMSDYEEKVILKALEKNRWHKQKTADSLKVHRKTLFQKIKKYGIK